MIQVDSNIRIYAPQCSIECFSHIDSGLDTWCVNDVQKCEGDSIIHIELGIWASISRVSARQARAMFQKSLDGSGAGFRVNPVLQGISIARHPHILTYPMSKLDQVSYHQHRTHFKPHGPSMFGSVGDELFTEAELLPISQFQFSSIIWWKKWNFCEVQDVD